MILCRRDKNYPNLQVENFTLGKVENLKYQKINICSKNDKHTEISERKVRTNKCYHSISTLLYNWNLNYCRESQKLYIIQVI